MSTLLETLLTPQQRHDAEAADIAAQHSRPCAAVGFTSYRCKSRYGWIMIGANDHDDAMREAARSTPAPRREDLQIWDGARYINAPEAVA